MVNYRSRAKRITFYGDTFYQIYIAFSKNEKLQKYVNLKFFYIED